jgi:predicted ArsR family transcriptional regulator
MDETILKEKMINDLCNKIKQRYHTIIVEQSDPEMFEKLCNILHNHNYVGKSYCCGFANSERYDFCSSYQAIFVLDNNKL